MIREGEGGDEMYFVSRGELSVIVGEKVVHTLKDGDFFGEVALMYDTPRTASITAIVRSQLFYLKKADFTTVVVQYPTESKSIAGIARERFKQFVLHDLVRKVPLFHQNTNDAFINDVVDLLRPHMYKPGEYIIEEGAGGEEMYFISRGELDVMVGGQEGARPCTTGMCSARWPLIYSTPRDGEHHGDDELPGAGADTQRLLTDPCGVPLSDGGGPGHCEGAPPHIRASGPRQKGADL